MGGIIDTRWLWEKLGLPVAGTRTGDFRPFADLGTETPTPPQPTATSGAYRPTPPAGTPEPWQLSASATATPSPSSTYLPLILGNGTVSAPAASTTRGAVLPTRYTYLPGNQSDGLNPFNPYGPRAYGPLPGDPSLASGPTAGAPASGAPARPASAGGGGGSYGIPAGVDPGWYRQFLAEHDGATPEQVYRSDGPDALRHADFDRQWGDQFYRTYGRRPSVYDWKASYYQRQRGFYGG